MLYGGQLMTDMKHVGLHIVGSKEGGVKRVLNYLCINEIIYFLGIRCFNLRNQTKLQDLPVLKTQKIPKYAITIEMPLSGSPDCSNVEILVIM